MALLDLWNESPDQLKDKQVEQLIAFAGKGKLRDDSDCSSEFRSYLSRVPSRLLVSYAEQCLARSFTDSGLALQDIVNEVGSRIGAAVTPGRYRGKTNQVGFDGLWRFDNGHAIVIEVKTTDAYRIDLGTIAGYRDSLVDSGQIEEDKCSMLFIVGREDTGDLEAQIRGSRYAWDIRLISVDGLLQLMSVKEEADDPQIINRIHQILVPREFTRLDEIAQILFSTTEDIKQEVIPLGEEVDISPKRRKEPKFTPVQFHEACVSRIESFLKETLVKRTRVQYSAPDKSVLVICLVSKEHEPDSRPNCWFGFHPYQRESLRSVKTAYTAFGCGSSERLLLIPFGEFESWLDGTWITRTANNFYWHVAIYREGEKLILHRKKGIKKIDLTKYVVPSD